MPKIPAARAAALFEEIVGWPYKLGGSGKTPGGVIDCSGAWVRVYRAHGLGIYHGSNMQFRYHCSRTGAIGGVKDLRAGMAVFKVRAWNPASPDDTRHRCYNTAPGNVYHVGCVTGVSPLRIVHATPPNAKADAALGAWRYWGTLAQVDYGGDAGGAAPLPPVPPPPPEPGLARVVTNGGNLNLRWLPETTRAPKNSMPNGTTVRVLRRSGDWAEVLYTDSRRVLHRGWCSALYLRFEEEEGAK